MGRIAAAVVTYNRRELLRECLGAVTGQTRPPDRMFVVDNGSTDGSGEMLAAEFPQATCLRLDPNIGSSGGFHEAVRIAYESGCDSIWLMDDDCRPADDALERLAGYRSRQSAGNVYGSVMVAQGSDERLAFPTAIFVDGKRRLCSSRRDFPGSGVVPTDSIGFNGLLLPREVVAEVGFPRKDFYIWWDDVEYARRIVYDYGYRMEYVADSLVYHPAAGYRRFRLPGLTGYYVLAPAWKQYYGVRNHLLLDRKYNPRWRFFLLVVPRRALFLLLAIGLWERRRLKAIRYAWRGLVDGVLGRTGCRVCPDEA